MAAKSIRLKDLLQGMRDANTPDELEAAIQVPNNFPYIGPTWTRIRNVRTAQGERLVKQHPLGRFVPNLNSRRQLSVCDETQKLGIGHNGAGARYVWHYAEEFAVSVMTKNGLSKDTACRVWEWWSSGYPHRCLQFLDKEFVNCSPSPEGKE